MTIFVKNKHALQFDEFEFKCCIGEKGLTSKKKEGDKKTPKGLYSLGSVYFRSDRIQKIHTNLKKIKINQNMGWCDDGNSTHYNKLININKMRNIKYEKLFRKSSNYDILIPIQYNVNKTIKNKGSAIFLHLTSNYQKTLGCIAIKRKDMLILLKLINQNTKILIS